MTRQLGTLSRREEPQVKRSARGLWVLVAAALVAIGCSSVELPERLSTPRLTATSTSTPSPTIPDAVAEQAALRTLLPSLDDFPPGWREAGPRTISVPPSESCPGQPVATEVVPPRVDVDSGFIRDGAVLGDQGEYADLRLVSFETEALAVQWMQVIRASALACSGQSQPQEDGSTIVTAETSAGDVRFADDRFAVVTSYRQSGTSQLTDTQVYGRRGRYVAVSDANDSTLPPEFVSRALELLRGT